MICFVDCETTGLDPDRHQMWELAIIRRDSVCDVEMHWQLSVDLSKADPAALRISGYYSRDWITTWYPGSPHVSAIEITDKDSTTAIREVRSVARQVARGLDGATIVGAVPSFDALFLEQWLRANGQCPTWHHRLRCVETLTAGFLRRSDVGGLAGCCEALGIKQDGEHTALGDARAARDIWDAVMGS